MTCRLAWLLEGTEPGPSIHHTGSTALSLAIAEPAPPAYYPSTYSKNHFPELDLFHEHHTKTIELRITDDAMEPRFQLGDHVAGVKRYGFEIAQVLHQTCIIEIENNKKPLLRYVREQTDPEHYTLMALNPHTTITYPTFYHVKLLSAAPVIWQRRGDPDHGE